MAAIASLSAMPGAVPDATTTTKGVVQLTGDLSGTATAPEVEGISASASGSVSTQQTTASTTYTDLATAGPTCSVTVPATRRALVIVSAEAYQTGAANPVFMSWTATGATVISVVDANALSHNGNGGAEQYSMCTLVTLTAGTTQFTAKYRVAGGTGRFANRRLVVIPI